MASRAGSEAVPLEWRDGFSSGPGGRRVDVVAISSILPPDSPRLAGEVESHTRKLADLDAVLPPILVHWPTMRLVDGMHRLRAAVLRGEKTIAVEYHHGGEEETFVLAVEANIAHGLPLSVADREAAAVRIIGAHPEWSDRAIAATTGLSARTVGSIRRRSTGGARQLNARVGRDGRVRPLDSGEGRRRAGEVIRARPDASLREIAAAAGISLGTARDVRQRLARGDDPVPRGCRRPAGGRNAPPAQDPSSIRRAEAAERRASMSRKLQNLKRDPSMRFTEQGRKVLRLLDVHGIGTEDWAGLADAVPAHCAVTVAELARECAELWKEVADTMQQPGRPATPEFTQRS